MAGLVSPPGWGRPPEAAPPVSFVGAAQCGRPRLLKNHPLPSRWHVTRVSMPVQISLSEFRIWI